MRIGPKRCSCWSVRASQAAQAVLETLPLVREKLIEFELIPLKPYPGFARLFETN